MDLFTPRDAGGPAASLVRPTDRVRRALRRAQILLGTLAVGIAVPIGIAAGASVPGPPAGVVTVEAQLLQPSPSPEIAMMKGATQTPARWTAPDGSPQTGLVWADSGLGEGAAVTLAVDPAGRPLTPQPQLRDPVATGIAAGVATLLICWGLLTVGLVAAHSRLATHDDRRWASDWRRVEPMWSKRS